MKLEPVITEKSMKLAEGGKYTFRVDIGLNKYQIKNIIQEVFGVHVTDVKTIKESGEVKKNFRGRIRVINPGKKAIVTLKEKEKIDLFETKKKAK